MRDIDPSSKLQGTATFRRGAGVNRLIVWDSIAEWMTCWRLMFKQVGEQRKMAAKEMGSVEPLHVNVYDRQVTSAIG